MAPLWNALEIEGRLGRELTADEATRLHLGLGAAVESELVSLLNRPVGARACVESRLFLPMLEGTTVFLQATPVISVESVSFDNGPSVNPSAYVVFPFGVAIYGPAFGLADPFIGPSTITVHYTAGIDAQVLGGDMVTALAGVLHSRLARELRYQGLGAGREYSAIQVEGADFRFNVTNAAAWDPGELDVIRGFRRRVIR